MVKYFDVEKIKNILLENTKPCSDSFSYKLPGFYTLIVAQAVYDYINNKINIL